MSGWDFRVPSWSEIEWRLSHWSDAVHTSIAGGLDRVGAAAQMPWRRIRCLRMAMWEGQSIARGNLLHRFADLDIQQILPGLLDAAKDMVMILAGAMATGGVIGGVVGGAVGAFGAGVSAVPGALAGAAGGAAIGLEVGNWILVLLGLGAIGEFVLASLPRLIDKYKRGIAIAWSGPQSPAGPYPDRHAHDREQDAIHAAAKAFAAADEALVTLLLAGIAAYLLHRGGKAVSVLSREVSSGRLGEKFGDWLARNAEKLKAREDLGGPQRGGVAGREKSQLRRAQGNVGADIKPSDVTNPETIYPDGLAYRSNLPVHLAGPDGFIKSGQLSGTHNLQNAVATLKAQGATYTMAPTSTAGISELQYRYSNAAGKIITGSKTVYDPAVYSDSAMLNMSQAAGQRGYEMYLQNTTQRIFEIHQSGVNFRIYINIDSKTGMPFVGNVHPIR